MVKLQTGSENFSNGFTDQSEQSFIMQNWDWFDMNPLLTFSFPFKEAYVHIRYFTYHLYGKPHAKLVQMGQESSTWRCVDSIPSFWNISGILPWTLSRILSESTDMYLLDGGKVKVIDDISCISYTELWMHCFCEKVRRMLCQASQRCFLPLVFCKRITASMQSAKANKVQKQTHTQICQALQRCFLPFNGPGLL